MQTKDILKEIEQARHEYLDYFNDHKPIIAETLNRSEIEDVEKVDTSTLEEFYSEVIEWDFSEYDDIIYIAGMIHALINLKRVIEYKELAMDTMCACGNEKLPEHDFCGDCI